jgi:hypothetical protein
VDGRILLKYFDNNDNWYRGNLHAHTTASDGARSINECAGIYSSNGYDFISITDHMTRSEYLKKGRFLLLSGCELNLGAFHFVTIGMDDVPMKTFEHPQQIIDHSKANSGMVIFAHPAWSLLSHELVMGLTGFDGVEIWNSVSDTRSGRGDSSIYIDVMAVNGLRPRIFASDDVHFYKEDLFGGWIMVNSRSLDEKEIMNNIREGRFYSSQGPEIKQIEIKKDRIFVETSPVKEIIFLTDTLYCADRVIRSGSGKIKRGEYRIKDTDSFVRIEIRDENCKKAWSQIMVPDFHVSHLSI